MVPETRDTAVIDPALSFTDAPTVKIPSLYVEDAKVRRCKVFAVTVYVIGCTRSVGSTDRTSSSV